MDNNQKLHSILSLLEDVFAKNDRVKDVENNEKRMEDSLKTLWETITSLKSQIDHGKSVVQSLINNLKCTQDQLTSESKKIDDLDRKSSYIVSEVDRKLKPLENTVVSLKQSIREEFEEKLKETKKEAFVPTSVIFQQNEEAVKKMEVTRLDVMNAVKKSNNTEEYLRILERKIETLSLQIKKLDINQQL